jgi:thioredoxin reductase (NADPH)
MSRYLIERIAGSPNIDVIGETEIVELLGSREQGPQGVRWRNRRTGVDDEQGATRAATRRAAPFG